ncbi:MAG: prolyl oligopeptidase family serine peptidase [Actinomycetota bacterium]|nr:prolyl oligopeptidase family serine peptidase [Actinomycetota bacterium]
MPSTPTAVPRPYPAAERLHLVEHLHGRPVADPYRWLEDTSDARTRAWELAQDALTDEHLMSLPGRELLRQRLTVLTGAGAASAPVWRRGRAFWTSRAAGAEHPVLWWRDGEGVARPLVDPAAIDPTGLTTLDGWFPSWEGDQLAYLLSSGGSEESLLRVLDVETGVELDGPIGRTRYSPVAWVPGGESFFYVRRLPAQDVPEGEDAFHRRVWRHQVGGDTAQDQLVWGEGLDPTSYFTCSVSRDGRWLLVTASAGTAPRDDVWLFDLLSGGPPAEVQVGVDACCTAYVREGRLWLLTDRDAPRGRLCAADPTRPSAWSTVLPEDPEAVLAEVAHVDGGLVAHRVRHALAELVWHPADAGPPMPIRLPGAGTLTGLTAEPEGGASAWFGWTDPRTPPRVHRIDTRSQKVSVWQDLSAGDQGVDGRATFVQQCSFTSRDGTTVRATVLSPTERPELPRPTVLYGYGGFRVALTPEYSASALAWVEAGGVWVEANLRGGSEEGEQWHRAGMREHKQNVFDDFAACAEGLVSSGWTTPDQLAIYGGSNGGLLVGAALTQHPQACAAVVCSAPLLDMVRYELSGLGRTWNDEYGTAADPAELAWLLGYSPYHHVREGERYPAVLFTVFSADSRVDPLHARKMCAALQYATSGDGPILLRREADVGHGARSVSRSVGLATDVLSFLATHTGLELP